ncbi:hypothetical protein [Legionella resiliens]|uniref:Periplasmic ligand-binding sensor domain protein n=1 Tax=Legionella resiliens TaxID=2905958 RepID=A0ABS8X4U8_9GAMM|nr:MULTISPECIES: hypothetical protein [unclassified Legionella]MCE0723142.1 hypothetical protein [Legionella sp. 9fVS26]MCE3532295.1 hypothetical protein [Legionella sp. 8cVS16]
MQTKKETQTPKTGQKTTTPIWSLPIVPIPGLTMPLDVVKQKLQASKTGQKPGASPVWNFPNLTPAPWFPDLSKMPWFSTPFDIVKQRMQTPKVKQQSGTTPVWSMPNFFPTSWFITPLDVVKHNLQSQKSGKKTTPSPVWDLPSYAWSFVPSKETVHQQLWNGTNFATVALATSLSIVAVQSPVKTMLVNLSKSGTMIPPYTGGIWSVAKLLYAGTGASISGSLVRTGYVTGAKGGSKPLEEGAHEIGKEEGKKYAISYSYVMAMALGDILVTQIPESLSTLKKVPGLLPTDFVWKTPNNAWKLMMGGFIPRYGSGMVNFAALCVLEERIAKSLPIQDKNVAHFTSGMFSGMAAAFFSYPFTSFKDYALVQSTVKDGHLHNASTIKLTKELFYCFISNPEASLKTFGSMALKQVPMRMGLTGVIFALVAGVGETLGSEPLAKVVSEKYQPTSPGKSKHSMFGGKQTTPRIEEVQETNEKEKDTGSKPQ